MKLVVGLGNPGMKYAATRHNIGFEVIDSISDAYNIQVVKNKYKALIGEGNIAGEKVILMKPQTYMNLSGEAVKECMDFYKIPIENLLIIYDDISLELGQLRIRESGSAGGHNGIKSIIMQTGTQNFHRVRVGVGEKPAGWDLADYVLSRFTEEEMKIVAPATVEAAKAVKTIISEGMQKAMNQYNVKVKR